MKILHLPYTFFPDPCGGTEIYVKGLTQELTSLGITNVIAAPATNNAQYQHENMEVRRFAITPNLSDLRAIYGEGDAVAAQHFQPILETEKPDLLHLHAFTSGVSIRMVRMAQDRKLPVLFTYHTPAVSCTRGDLLHEGRTVCDGQLNADTCSKCVLTSKGFGNKASVALNWLGKELGGLAEASGLKGSVGTGLRLNSLIQVQHQALKELCTSASRVIVLCNWTRELLERNSLATGKVMLCRHGVQDLPAKITRDHIPSVPIKLLYLGRADPIKGIDWIIDGIVKQPELPLQLDLFTQLDENAPYAVQLKKSASRDRRINLKTPVQHAQIPETLSSYDLLLVPSRVLETGPLVVLEALANGLPVAGSNLGGIKEWIEPGKNGFLIEPNAHSWEQFLSQLPERAAELQRLSTNTCMGRTMKDVAREMQTVYGDVLAAR